MTSICLSVRLASRQRLRNRQRRTHHARLDATHRPVIRRLPAGVRQSAAAHQHRRGTVVDTWAALPAGDHTAVQALPGRQGIGRGCGPRMSSADTSAGSALRPAVTLIGRISPAVGTRLLLAPRRPSSAKPREAIGRFALMPCSAATLSAVCGMVSSP